MGRPPLLVALAENERPNHHYYNQFVDESQSKHPQESSAFGGLILGLATHQFQKKWPA